MHRWSAIALCAALAPTSAWAQQTDNTVIKRQQSKLVLDMPGLHGQREIYQYFGWDKSYSEERYYGAQFPRSGAYPRAQFHMTLLAPGYVWSVTRDIDEKFLQGFVSFLKDKTIKLVARSDGGTNARERTVRFEVDGADCIFFAAVPGMGLGMSHTSTSQARQPNVRGFYCGPIGAKLTDTDVAAVRSGFRFVPNPTPETTAPLPAPTPAVAAPANAPAPTPTAANSSSPAAVAAVPAARSIPGVMGWTAAPGTRFMLNTGGYLQVQRHEGVTAFTVNNSNATGRWTGGLVARRPKTKMATEPFQAFSPLAVGKSMTVEERSDTNSDSWVYTITVVRTEQLTIKDKSYDTFVVTVRDQSQNPDQGGLDRTRTLWVSPEAGGILRYRTTQAAGPPVTFLPNWDVVEIVPPS